MIVLSMSWLVSIYFDMFSCPCVGAVGQLLLLTRCSADGSLRHRGVSGYSIIWIIYVFTDIFPVRLIRYMFHYCNLSVGKQDIVFQLVSAVKDR